MSYTIEKMIKRISILLFLFVFSVSVSSAVAMACCWDMEETAKASEHSMSMDMEEDCHSSAEKDKTSNTSDQNSENGTGDCCYNMMECQVQLFKTANIFTMNTQAFDINYGNKTDKFISNTTEPLKHPPKVLL